MSDNDENIRDQMLEVYCDSRKHSSEPPPLNDVLSRCTHLWLGDAGIAERFKEDVRLWEQSTQWWNVGMLPTIPGYDNLCIIGAGGAGVVYRATQQSLDRSVALKTMSWYTPLGESRLKQEARQLAKIGHSNVVRVHDLVKADDATPFLVMEYVAGGTLKDLIAGCGQEQHAAAESILALALAVQQIHAQDILHLDLKSSNVLVGDNGTLKVSDFGLAELASTIGLAESGKESLTASRSAATALDERTDVYALGAILYELLTGASVPEENRKQGQLVIRSIVSGRPVNKDLAAICEKCLAPDPSNRYRSAKALVEDVTRYLKTMPVHARPSGALSWTLKFTKRRPAIAVALSIGLVCLLILIAGLVAERRERKRADGYYSLARQAVEESTRKMFVSSLSSESEEMRRVGVDVLQTILAFYEDLAGANSEDTSFELHKARLYWGLTEMLSGLDTKDAKQQALAHAVKMEAIASRLTEVDPHNPECSFLHGWSLGWQAIMLRDLSEPELAEQACTEAIEILDAAVKMHPDHAGCSVKLGACLMHRGALALDRGDHEQAERWYYLATEQFVKPIAFEEAQLHRLEVFLKRAVEFATQFKEWTMAARLYRQLKELNENEPRRWYDWATALMAARRMQEHASACKDMLVKFEETSDRATAERVLYAYVMGPVASSDVSRIVRFAEKIKGGGAEKRLHGALAYQLGDYDTAVHLLESIPDRPAWDSFFLALAYAQRNEPELARQRRDFGEAWRPDYEPGWDERAQLEKLREEIAALLGQ